MPEDNGQDLKDAREVAEPRWATAVTEAAEDVAPVKVGAYHGGSTRWALAVRRRRGWRARVLLQGESSSEWGTSLAAASLAKIEVASLYGGE